MEVLVLVFTGLSGLFCLFIFYMLIFVLTPYLQAQERYLKGDFEGGDSLFDQAERRGGRFL